MIRPACWQRGSIPTDTPSAVRNTCRNRQIDPRPVSERTKKHEYVDHQQQYRITPGSSHHLRLQIDQWLAPSPYSASLRHPASPLHQKQSNHQHRSMANEHMSVGYDSMIATFSNWLSHVGQKTYSLQDSPVPPCLRAPHDVPMPPPSAVAMTPWPVCSP